MDERVIVALDTPDLQTAEKLIQDLRGLIGFYKIGFEFFLAEGWRAVELVKKSGAKVFLDLKLHDIPNTVAQAAKVICEHEVDMFNVHAFGGSEMMKQTMEAVTGVVAGRKKSPLVIAVTVLTSYSQEQLNSELNVSLGLKEQVLSFAKLAEHAGLHGVVCSPQEAKFLRQELPQNFILVTPGVRPAQAELYDQKRVYTPKDAILAGSTYLVVGRPITQATRPRASAEAILGEIKELKAASQTGQTPVS